MLEILAYTSGRSIAIAIQAGSGNQAAGSTQAPPRAAGALPPGEGPHTPGRSPTRSWLCSPAGSAQPPPAAPAEGKNGQCREVGEIELAGSMGMRLGSRVAAALPLPTHPPTRPYICPLYTHIHTVSLSQPPTPPLTL